MTTFREFQNELERLHQQSESVRRQAKGAALEKIRAWIAEYDLTLDELGLTASGRPRRPRAPSAPSEAADAAPPEE